MLETWFPVVLLALEATEVIGLRLAKLAGGDADAQQEVHLMVIEKIDAVIQVSGALLDSASAGEVFSRVRGHVAANAIAANVRPEEQWVSKLEIKLGGIRRRGIKLGAI